MKTPFATAAVLAACILKLEAQIINTSGTPTSCGEHTCCIPECLLTWTDSNGCVQGQAEVGGACSNAFSANTDTMDSGVDICDGSGAFFCTTDGGVKVIYVANRDNVVSAALWPATYPECTLSGQCAGCDEKQSSCQDPVIIGTSTDHNCAAFAGLLTSSNVNLVPC